MIVDMSMTLENLAALAMLNLYSEGEQSFTLRHCILDMFIDIIMEFNADLGPKCEPMSR